MNPSHSWSRPWQCMLASRCGFQIEYGRVVDCPARLPRVRSSSSLRNLRGASFCAGLMQEFALACKAAWAMLESIASSTCRK